MALSGVAGRGLAPVLVPTAAGVSYRHPQNPQLGRRFPTLGCAGRPGRHPGRLRRPLLRPRCLVLLVGAVGVANIMIISVLERGSEIGLRRALGATRGHIRARFLAEAVLLALIGGAAGVGAGALATTVYASSKHEMVVIPALAWAVASAPLSSSAPSPSYGLLSAPPGCRRRNRFGACDRKLEGPLPAKSQTAFQTPNPKVEGTAGDPGLGDGSAGDLAGDHDRPAGAQNNIGVRRSSFARQRARPRQGRKCPVVRRGA